MRIETPAMNVKYMIIKLIISLIGLAAAGCSSISAPPVIDRDAGVPVAQTPVATAPVPAPGPRAAPAPPRGGGYYKDDGPGDSPPPDLDKLADAQPRIEPLHRFANNPYNVFGQDYVPMRAMAPFRQTGIASWYGKKFHGQRTSSGEIYDMYAMTAAHPTLPIPSYVRVSNRQNGRSVIVRVNDRGPFHAGRVIDLSFAAAFRLGYVIAGSTQVQVELLQPDEIAGLAARGPERAGAPSPRPADAATSRAPEPAVSAQAERSASDVAPAKPAAATAGVYLQLGAFSARDNAESFRARVYREVGWLKDPIEILLRDGLFRLHLGPYRDREQAGSVADQLRREIELRPVFVSR